MRASPLKRAFARPRARRDGGAARRAPSLRFSLSLARRAARANNGIPGSLGVLLPLDKPQEIGLATTFGLILSDDGGTSWSWTCEQAATTRWPTSTWSASAAAAIGILRLYARSLVTGLAYSDDESCGWQSAGGALAGLKISDFFPTVESDARARRGVAARPTRGGPVASVYVSTDGGATFGATPLYTARRRRGDRRASRSRAAIRRSSTSPPTPAASAGYDPVLVRSVDGGASWTPTDLLATPVGSAIVRILAVDPADANLVYLRATGATSARSLAVTRDGGMTFATPLTIANGAVSAFARLASGTVLVGALINLAGGGGGTMGAGYRSDRRGDDLPALDAATRSRTWSASASGSRADRRRSISPARTTATAGRWRSRPTKGPR